MLADTRRSLHAVAETLMAGPQYRVAGTIRLAVSAGGFATGTLPGEPSLVSVRGTDLVVVRDGAELVLALAGPLGRLADEAGVTFGPPEGLYADTTGADRDTLVVIDPAEAAEIAGAFAVGDEALRELAAAAGAGPDVRPVLWPEHFDLGLSVDEVNYGVSPGDATIDEPYAYVGPWTPRTGAFWNQPFGAACTLRELGGADAVAAYFQAGRAAVATDVVDG